ncbi:MAG: signal recognition particle-docking protein FtsY [Synergistaceae bacterium]|nr:signal recognition particle-docking protein FtsY [Synergistaceae bacterium]MBP9958136.1 signal recognition particle-docking protein FtsY [Synergistaceae bacterium]
MAIWSDFVDKLKTITNKWSQGVSNLFSDSPLTEAFWEELEEQLIMGDVGIETTVSLLAELRKLSVDRRIANTHELKSVFAELLIDKMMQVPRMGEPLNVSESPSVIMLVGVNGSGKTTTAGKLAAQYKGEGLSVVLAAADTFRAAAIEQLKAWGEKVGVRVVAQSQGSDSAAVVYDAIQSARASGTQVVLADTAGRLHTKANLMDELSKVNRVVCREIESGPAEILLVLDSVTGQNGFLQAEAFNKALPLSGVILTKFDNTAKGGIVISIADRLKLPIRYVGLGEGVDDLMLFDAKGYIDALLGIENKEINAE